MCTTRHAHKQSEQKLRFAVQIQREDIPQKLLIPSKAPQLACGANTDTRPPPQIPRILQGPGDSRSPVPPTHPQTGSTAQHKAETNPATLQMPSSKMAAYVLLLPAAASDPSEAESTSQPKGQLPKDEWHPGPNW